ncbi:hypothetical protein CSC82_16345 [Rhodobacteraceae bacterium 4F10]|nr:hypothetical protein CSC82_16345 [Rhodobacteraceae bacterium 4F10]
MEGGVFKAPDECGGLGRLRLRYQSVGFGRSVCLPFQTGPAKQCVFDVSVFGDFVQPFLRVEATFPKSGPD